MPWRYPLFEGPRVWPDLPGQFGTPRKHDVHTGIDLYTWPGMPVLACEAGVVVAIEDFTGPQAGSPWWHDTQAILIEGASGVICYGEVGASPSLKVGDSIEREDCLGTVKTVLKQDKGRPLTMLHVELYVPGSRETVVWKLGAPRPPSLVDVTPFLRESFDTLPCPKSTYQGSGPL